MMKEKILILMLGLLVVTGAFASVAPVNAAVAGEPALANVQSMSTPEDVPCSVNLSDVFPAGWISVSGTPSAHINVDVGVDVAVFSPVLDWNGQESVFLTATYYSVTPPDGDTIQSTVDYTVEFNISVTPVNDAPFVLDSAPSFFRIYGDTTTYVNLNYIFGDGEGDSLTFTVNSSAAEVTVLLDVDGKMELISDPEYYGVSDMVITASDGQLSTSLSLDVYATPTRDLMLDEDTYMLLLMDDYLPSNWYRIDVTTTSGLQAYYDADDNAVYVTTVENWNGDGIVELTASYYSASPPGDDTIQSFYTLTADVPASVFPVNDPPYIKQEISTVVEFNEDTTLSADLYNFFGDIDNVVLNFSASVSTSAVQCDITQTGTITLTPSPDWSGACSVDIVATDGEYNVSMIVPLYVSPTPDVYMSEDNSVYIDLLNFFDSGWVSMSAVSSDNVSVTLDGTLARFTPASNWNGEEFVTFSATYVTTLVPYMAPNAAPKYRTVSKVADIRVAPVNDAPYVKSNFPGYFQINEDESIMVNLYDYFEDVDDTYLQFTASSMDGNVSFVFDSMGNMTIIPAVNWSGSADLAITAFDGEYAVSAVITMSVSPTPDIVMDEDSFAYIDIGDYFDPGWVSLNITQNGVHVTASVDLTNNRILFTPSPNWHGHDKVTISAVYDNSRIWSEINTAPGYITVSKIADIFVSPVNDPPVQTAALPQIAIDEDGTYTFNVADYFTDIDSSLSFEVSAPPEISVSLDPSTGQVTLSPAANWNGAANLQISVSDGEYTVYAAETMVVNPVNDAPVWIQPLPEFQMNEDSILTIDLNEYVMDVDSPLAFTASPNGSFDISVNETGIAIITPAANWSGNGEIEIVATDGMVSITGTALLRVLPVNDAPVQLAALPALNFDEDGMVFVYLGSYFMDIDSPLSFTVTAGAGLTANVSATNHVMRVQGLRNWNGDSSLEIIVTDGEFSITAVSTVHIAAVNDPPVATPLSQITGYEDIPTNIDLDDYFADVDSVLTFTYSAPSHIRVSIDPGTHIATMTAPRNWYGTANLRFIASDGQYAVDITPALVVQPRGDAPQVTGMTNLFEGSGGTQIVVDLSSLFRDPDGDSLTYSVVAADGSSVSVTIDQATSTLTIVLPHDAAGTYSFNVTASDGSNTISRVIYAVSTPSSTFTTASVGPTITDASVLLLVTAAFSAVVGMLIYHIHQYRKYGAERKKALI